MIGSTFALRDSDACVWPTVVLSRETQVTILYSFWLQERFSHHFENPLLQSHPVQEASIQLWWQLCLTASLRRTCFEFGVLCDVFRYRLWCEHAWHLRRTTRQHFDPKVLKSTEVFPVLAEVIDGRVTLSCRLQAGKTISTSCRKRSMNTEEIAPSCTRCGAHCLSSGTSRLYRCQDRRPFQKVGSYIILKSQKTVDVPQIRCIDMIVVQRQVPTKEKFRN